MFIAPGIESEEWIKLNLDDNNSDDWNMAIDIFITRIQIRYIDPADLLIKEDELLPADKRRYGFSIMALDCLLIEALQSFRDGLKDTKSKSKEMFRKFLTERNSFKSYFSEDDAFNFFYDIRCGILHQAETMGNSLLYSIGDLKGTNQHGISYINRTKFHEALKIEFNKYIEDLKIVTNINLRKNFRIKMDYIARSNYSKDN